MAEAVGCRLVIAEAWIRSLVNPL